MQTGRVGRLCVLLYSYPLKMDVSQWEAAQECVEMLEKKGHKAPAVPEPGGCFFVSVFFPLHVSLCLAAPRESDGGGVNSNRCPKRGRGGEQLSRKTPRFSVVEAGEAGQRRKEVMLSDFSVSSRHNQRLGDKLEVCFEKCVKSVLGSHHREDIV
ncbi:hypothetical protein XENOCAPTIV_001517 [Xenoophorus captivus]|uniref:Uncharacterized protein n=1 Tax=Xenoophorus captivus TaxID=1517983 RepID=A0ABV0RJW4_9TELE